MEIQFPNNIMTGFIKPDQIVTRTEIQITA